MSKLIKDIREGLNAEQQQLFHQVIDKHTKAEEQYQVSMQQKLKELQEKANNLAKQELEGLKIETSAVDNSELVAQLNQLKEQAKSLSNEIQEKSNQLQGLQAENAKIEKKTAEEQAVIDRIHSMQDNNSHGDDHESVAVKAEARLAGALHEGE